MSHESWIAPRVMSPRARVRLVCYPHAGGGASAFAGWRSRLPESVDLCAIEPPGRWTRHREPLVRRVDELAEGLAATLQGALDLPYVLLGHSLGSLVIFETARRLRTLGCRAPEHLVVAAPRALSRRRDGDGLHSLSDDELLGRVREIYGAERLEAMEDPELRALFLPVLRADLEAYETYVCREEEAFSCRLSAYGGADDRAFREETLAEWRAQTQAISRGVVLEGGHFFVHEAASRFLEHLLEILDEAAAAFA